VLVKVRLVALSAVAVACTAIFLWTHSFEVVQVVAAQRATSVFNSGQVRPTEDPAMVAKGKTLYAVNCQACHGQDLRGGDMGGPNLLRSQVTLADQHGENIVPIIQGGRMAQGMPKIGITIDDSKAVAAYLRSVIGTIGRQGAPPGEEKVLDIVVGDPEQGRSYFAAHCQKCHSAEGDLKGIANRVPDAKVLQARWVSGGASSRSRDAAATVTAEVFTSSGDMVEGQVTHIDDFLITLALNDGTSRSFERIGAKPKVVVHDPLQAHQDMLRLYSDRDIHDVTAYLVTLK
jgi:cytochrome c oxidase cbb3-type subunit 3